MGVAFGKKPVGGIVGGFKDGIVGFEAILLPEIEKAEHRRHSQFVGFVENLFNTSHVVGAELAIVGEGGIVPGLLPGIALRTAALEVDGEGNEAGFAVEGKRGEELVGVAVGVEIPAVGIFPE